MRNLFLLSIIFIPALTWAQTIAYRSGHSLVPFREKDKWGYSDMYSDSILIKPIYDDADLFSENGLALIKSGALWGYIDYSGHTVIKPSYTYATPFYHVKTQQPLDYAEVARGKKVTHISSKNRRIKEPVALSDEMLYQVISFPVTSNTVMLIKRHVENDSVVVINTKLHIPKNDMINFEEHNPIDHMIIASHKISGKKGVITYDQELVLPFAYDNIQFSSLQTLGEEFIVTVNALVGYISLKNNISVKPKYKSIVRVDQNVIEVVTKTGKKGFISTHGREFFDE
jgi:hypothetical protein